jgi:hypothetical protein
MHYCSPKMSFETEFVTCARSFFRWFHVVLLGRSVPNRQRCQQPVTAHQQCVNRHASHATTQPRNHRQPTHAHKPQTQQHNNVINQPINQSPTQIKIQLYPTQAPSVNLFIYLFNLHCGSVCSLVRCLCCFRVQSDSGRLIC